jgi:nicotinamide-nucleotide amidase
VNRHGSAPGIWIEEEGSGWVAMLPGVPRELKGLFADEVRPRLELLAGRDAVVASRTLRTTGIAEATLAELILRSDLRVHSLAYLPGARGVDLRVTVRGLGRDAADRLLGEDIEKLRSLAGERAYGEEDMDLAEVVLQLARAGSITLAVAESCTGGMLGARLTAVPGSSQLFSGGVIAYADEAKRTLLGVKQATLEEWGAVSEATAQEMATGVRHRLGAGCGIAITGIAGPAGGSAEKPVGTVCVAIELEGNSRAVSHVLPGDRDEIRQRACQMALDLTRVELLRRNTVR